MALLMASCRFCTTSLDVKKRCSLFSKDAVVQKLPDRFSSFVQLPVSETDGLSLYCCRKCLGTLHRVEKTTEEMRSLAKSSYSNASRFSSVTSSPTAREHSRKRVKDTSGHGASPHTTQARPAAKRALGNLGRRLTFSSLDRPCSGSAPLTERTNARSHGADVPTADVETGVEKTTSVVDDIQVMMTVNSPVRASSLPFSTHLDSSLQNVGRALAGGDPRSIAKAVLSEAATRQHVLNRVFQEIGEECARVCRRQPVSVFRKVTSVRMETFSWDWFSKELETVCPILFHIFETVVTYSDHRNSRKKGVAHHPGMCLAAAILLKERNREMVGVQSILSLVLFNSRVAKNVYLRLNRLNVCISYRATISLVSEISKRHKEPLERWIESGEDFKFVGDNVAKRKVVRDIRSDHHSHLVQMYSILAVKSRVIHPPSPAEFSPLNVTSLRADQCLPTVDDIQSIKQNLIVLVSRTVCKYVKCLQKYMPSVCSHIAHAHSKEMATKSEVIVLDVLHKNETKGADMIDIMREMHDYLGDSSKIRPSGGDYVTVERQRCSQQHLMDSDTQRGRLGLVEPCAEDWHCLMNVLMNVWKHLFSKSSRDHGTLTHLLTQLRRLPEARLPKDNMNACQDVILTIYDGHIVAKALEVLGIQSPDEYPAQSITVDDLKQLATTIVDSCTIVSEAILGKTVEESGDGVYNYSRVLCHYIALVTEFLDGWSEGDGERVLRCWKVFLMHFYSDRRTKYAFEALRLQFQLVSLPPHLVSQMTWDRFVNTHGGNGHNIPCDLHNEHVNGLFKEIVGNMGSNFTQEASTKAARAVSSLARMAHRYDSQTNIHPQGTAHTRKSGDNDLNMVVKVVMESKCLQIISHRHHSNFKDMKLNPLQKFKRDDFNLWAKSKMRQYDKYNGQDIDFEENDGI